jgi:L-iditol 2-dehydrogenase
MYLRLYQMVVCRKIHLPWPCLQVPDDLTDEKAILIEPIAVIVHAFRKVKITKGTRVAIVGSGNEGVLAATLAYHLGALVTAIDINPKKHELIRKFGNITAAFPEDIQNETFDVVIEAAGTKSSFELGIQLVHPGGTMVLIGFIPEANIPVTHIVRNEITLLGSIIYDFPSDYEQTIVYLRDSNFNIEPVISQIVPLSECRNAYENALSGDFGKIIFKF